MRSYDYCMRLDLKHEEPYFVDGHWVGAKALVFDLATEDIIGIFYDEGGEQFADTPAIKRTSLRAQSRKPTPFAQSIRDAVKSRLAPQRRPEGL